VLKIGAHVSIGGGYTKALERIAKIGGNCMQIFSASPRGWNFAKLEKNSPQPFLIKKKELGIKEVYFHASYLVNLADTGKIGHLSKKMVINEMNIGKEFKIKGSIVHLGSYKKEKTTTKYRALVKNIKEILAKTPSQTIFIIENSGTRKIGQNLEEIGQIVDSVNSKRVKICLDTCHLYAVGYSLKTQKELSGFLKKFNDLIGLERLELWHLNDSRDPLGSFRDRHENIGQGTIGLKEFGNIINHPLLKSYPFILETPGFDGKGPDKKNVDIVKSLREE